MLMLPPGSRRDGYVLTMKRLEAGRYRIPWRSEQGHVVVEAAELLLVLEGIDPSSDPPEALESATARRAREPRGLGICRTTKSNEI